MNVRRSIALALMLGAAGAWAQSLETTRVVARETARKLKLPGEFMPYERVDLQARVNGYVEKVMVDRGSLVKKDQLLVTLSAPEITAQLTEAQMRVQSAEAQRAEAAARYVSAKAVYDRLKTASATAGAVAGAELVTAEASMNAANAAVQAQEGTIKAAQAAVQNVKEMQGYLQVAAPFAGTITERIAHPGTLVGPAAGANGTLLRLEQTSRLRLVVALPEAEVGHIARGARVVFTVPAYPGEQFRGTVARLARALDPKTRTMAVELDVMNGDGRLAPGMYPEVQWPVRVGKPALLVPATAVVTTTERTFVIRVNRGAAEYVNVTRGPAAGDLVEVRGGLSEGDTIIKRGTDEIREGARIR